MYIRIPDLLYRYSTSDMNKLGRGPLEDATYQISKL